MIVLGLPELLRDLAVDNRIYGKTMRVLWGVADEGLKHYKANVARASGETANTATAGTSGKPMTTVRAAWGPTTEAGRIIESGTAHTPPRNDLDQSLDAVLGSALSKLQDEASKW